MRSASRMNQVQRVLHLIRDLPQHPCLEAPRLTDLASRYGVSWRTILRDICELQNAGYYVERSRSGGYYIHAATGG